MILEKCTQTSIHKHICTHRHSGGQIQLECEAKCHAFPAAAVRQELLPSSPPAKACLLVPRVIVVCMIIRLGIFLGLPSWQVEGISSRVVVHASRGSHGAVDVLGPGGPSDSAALCLHEKIRDSVVAIKRGDDN